ncbi:MAG TPA: nucleotidyltransferase family protein [Solirubrobacter sp.]|nr:nucleotidyltransferase family protein [Solirubrobacter sp.]
MTPAGGRDEARRGESAAGRDDSPRGGRAAGRDEAPRGGRAAGPHEAPRRERAAGLILAAGAGTRFGEQTKQLADLNGRPLLQYAVDAMNAALERVVVVLGHDAEAIAAAIDFGAAQTVICAEWARGQGFSLRRGVAELAGADVVVVTLGDQPFITPAVITAALAERGAHDALRAVYDGVPGHPVVLGPRVLAAVPQLEGDAGARELLARFDVRKWDASALADTTDIDTPEELCGVCAGAAPPLLGDVLTGTRLTLADAAERLERGEALPGLTPIQRRLVEDFATRL